MGGTGQLQDGIPGGVGSDGTFAHEALFYEGEEGFFDATLPFIREGIDRAEPILVAVSGAKIEGLRDRLDGDARRVQFADMADIGRNPATIIPAWRDFVDRHGSGGQRLRGIGEPIWAGRTPQELVECHLHESLLNLAFAGPPAWRLVCPYDTASLPEAVIEQAHRTHPVVSRSGRREPSPAYAGVPRSGLDTPLAEPEGPVEVLSFGEGSLAVVRSFVTAQATKAGIDDGRTAELVVAVNEVATNSIRYGGGLGSLRVWQQDASLICEVRDRGRIENLLAGRALPGTSSTGGYGLWLVNHICDLVQVRSFGDEGVVRMYMRIAGAG